MCGIVGFNWEDANLIKKMLNCIKHRGPDEEGFYTDKKVSIGSRRLSIIDLTTKGRQPLVNEDGTILTVYNGEIYNFIELREELKQKGHKFKSDTDTEVIVHSYEEHGIECFGKFNGMFAIAIWDSKKKELILARDRLGKKPLYYYNFNKKFIFASEIKSVLEFNINKELNESSVYHYLTFGYTPREESIFVNIKKLEPGSILLFKNDKIKIKSYWKLDFSQKIGKSENYFASEIIKHLEDAVKKRLIADVPVGAFLSGGIDSSAITMTIKKFKKDLKTFSIGFEYEQYNESKYAKIVSDKFETQHYEKIFYSDDVVKLLPKIIYHFDEPFGDPSAIPTYLVSELARKHVTVSLSGDGGDESFLGYNRYSLYQTIQFQDNLPKVIINPTRNIVQAIPTFLPLFGKLKTYLKYGKLNGPQRYMEIESAVKFEDKEKLFTKNLSFESEVKRYFIYKDYLDNLSNFDFNNYLAEDILTKLDRASMAVSLESRVPILDYKFVEFTASIPSYLKLKNGISKYIFKKALNGMLPDAILNRKKQGFVFPLDIYIRKELKDCIAQELSEKHRINEYVKKDYLAKLLRLHYSGRKDYTSIIWSIFILKKWLDEWLPE